MGIAESAGPDTRVGMYSQLQVGNSTVIAKDSIYSFWDAGVSAYWKQQISVWWISQRVKGNGSEGKYNLCQGGKEITHMPGQNLVLPGDELLYPAHCHLLVEQGVQCLWACVVRLSVFKIVVVGR